MQIEVRIPKDDYKKLTRPSAPPNRPDTELLRNAGYVAGAPTSSDNLDFQLGSRSWRLVKIRDEVDPLILTYQRAEITQTATQFYR